MYDLILTNKWVVYISIFIGVTTLLQILGKHVVRYLTNNAEKLNIILNAITKNGAQCAFPTQTVYTHVINAAPLNGKEPVT